MRRSQMTVTWSKTRESREKLWMKTELEEMGRLKALIVQVLIGAFGTLTSQREDRLKQIPGQLHQKEQTAENTARDLLAPEVSGRRWEKRSPTNHMKIYTIQICGYIFQFDGLKMPNCVEHFLSIVWRWHLVTFKRKYSLSWNIHSELDYTFHRQNTRNLK